MTRPTLTERDYIEAAKTIGCDVAAIKAVDEVESAGSGFHPDGQPRVLFEAHIFSRLTNGIYDASHPKISSAEWNQKLYLRGIREHTRLQAAVALNRNAALQSASWGRFQIMGFNFSSCGYSTLQEFINAMYRSEADHLSAFVRFVQGRGLDGHLREHNWPKFAAGYNGRNYAANKYDTKLEAAYKKHAKKA